MIRSGQSARVVMDIAFDGSGKVTRAELVESSAISGGRLRGKLGRDFASAIVKTALGWTFEPETVAGEGVSGGGRLPIWFCLDNGCGDLRETTGEGDSRLADANPAVRLRSDVAGTML